VWAVCLLAMVVLAGCQGKVDVVVQVQPDGSGVVRVGVGLDADALARNPDLAKQVRTDDLRSAGWSVEGPNPESDGFTWWRASKSFANPQEASAVLAEVSGTGGPLASLRLQVDRSFGRTTYRADGDVDFGGGLSRFADPELSTILDGQPLGVAESDLAQQFGAPVDQVVSVKVSVELPGKPPLVVTPSLKGPAVPVHLRATRYRRASFVAVGVGAVAVLLALLWVVVHDLRRRWARPRHAV
jgi:hypothetical protein